MQMRTQGGFGLIIWAWLLLAVAPVSAASLAVGDELPVLTLKDQHDRPVVMPGDAQLLLFAVEKPAADLVNRFLDKQRNGFLERHGAVFLMDISAMPKMITRMFALPKMRKRPYRIVLADDAEALAFLPRRQNQVTVVELNAGVVEQIDFVVDESDLGRRF